MAPIKSTFGRSVGKLLGSLRERDLRLTSGVRTNRYIPLGATGGTISLSRTGYSVHTFTPSTSSVFQWNATSSIPGVEYLIIGGGGAGGDSFMPFAGYNSGGGGGGAGGMRSGTLTLPSSGSFSISVGPGGQSSVTSFPQSPTVFAQPGTASYANFPTGTVTSEGGGRGGAGNAGSGAEPKSYAADNGASGGGGVRDLFNSAGTGNRVAGTSTPVPSQGNPGGGYSGPDGHGGGGGGAGGSGDSRDGGSGSTSSITGSSLTYAGGGGGGSGASPSSPGSGGSGGGGAGGADASVGSPASSTAPGANYGAGGGGGGRGASFPGPSMLRGGNANPGVVIIAVPTAYF